MAILKNVIGQFCSKNLCSEILLTVPKRKIQNVILTADQFIDIKKQPKIAQFPCETVRNISNYVHQKTVPHTKQAEKSLNCPL